MGAERLHQLILVAGLAWASLPLAAHADPDLRPAWVDDYSLISPRLEGQAQSYLLDTRECGAGGGLQAWVFDPKAAPALRQRYEDFNRDYEMRQRYGLVNPDDQQARVGQVQDFGHGVIDQVKNSKIDEQGEKVTHVIEQDERLKTVAAPAAVAAGVYIGKPVKVRITDGTRLSLRTDFRGRTGSVQVESPLATGGMDFRPDAAPQRDLQTSSSVDFGQAMNLGQVVDLSQERYLFSVYSQLPVGGLRSGVFYGSSSNSVAGSLSKSLTDNLTCAVDSVHALAPSSGPGSEEKVRLRYDFHF